MPKRRRLRSPWLWVPAVVILAAFALVGYEALRSGRSFGKIIADLVSPGGGAGRATRFRKGKTIDFLLSRPIGEAPPGEKSTIAHVAIYDLDRDGLNDVLVCDVLNQRVTWIRQYPKGVYTERQVGDPITAPVHVEACDIDRDGDLDLLVAAMGLMLPNNNKIGKVIILENDGEQNFTNRIIVENVARVTDVQPGDLDGDGDIDLAVAQFGYDQGEIRWMRNDGNWRFESHILQSLAGTIHIPIVDLDGDGDLDIVALVSQEWEEVYVFENDGRGNFETRLLHGIADADYGSSGIGLADLDADGDTDILWANGDAFVAVDYRPLPSHGMQWLENRGAMKFEFHRIGDFAGAYDPCAADLDGDGDLDVLAVSAFNNWERPAASCMRWWENLGGEGFLGHDLARTPTHLITVDVADMDGDGKPDLVTGSMNLYPPFTRIGRVTLWLNRWNESGNW